jgi:hypothetical protein
MSHCNTDPAFEVSKFYLGSVGDCAEIVENVDKNIYFPCYAKHLCVLVLTADF